MRFSGSRKLADTAANVKRKRAATAMSAYPRPTTTKVSGNGRETESAEHARARNGGIRMMIRVARSNASTTTLMIRVARSNVSTDSLGPVEKPLNGSIDERIARDTVLEVGRVGQDSTRQKCRVAGGSDC